MTCWLRIIWTFYWHMTWQMTHVHMSWCANMTSGKGLIALRHMPWHMTCWHISWHASWCPQWHTHTCIYIYTYVYIYIFIWISCIILPDIRLPKRMCRLTLEIGLTLKRWHKADVVTNTRLDMSPAMHKNASSHVRWPMSWRIARQLSVGTYALTHVVHFY